MNSVASIRGAIAPAEDFKPAVNRQPGYRRVDSQSGYKQKNKQHQIESLETKKQIHAAQVAKTQREHMHNVKYLAAPSKTRAT